jgi:hypothetical protein
MESLMSRNNGAMQQIVFVSHYRNKIIVLRVINIALVLVTAALRQ